MTIETPEKLLSIAEFAELAEVSSDKVNKWVQKGFIEVADTHYRKKYFRASDLAAALEAESAYQKQRYTQAAESRRRTMEARGGAVYASQRDEVRKPELPGPEELAFLVSRVDAIAQELERQDDAGDQPYTKASPEVKYLAKLAFALEAVIQEEYGVQI